jgi:adenosyl cobinamide kinase/adenosyl cobinamide phosphate guanylyltransferase
VKLVIGGAYQGKLDFALAHYGLHRGDVYTCKDTTITLNVKKPVIYGFEKWVLAIIRAEFNVQAELDKLMSKLADKIIIATDISAGVVPLDAETRAWREEAGRATVKLAQRADEVYRLFVGIPTKLK